MSSPHDDAGTERELRIALAERAREVRPGERLDEILRTAGDDSEARSRWLWPSLAAVAAAAVAVTSIVWAARPDSADRLPAASPTPSVTGPQATSTTPTPASSATPTTTVTATVTPSPSAPSAPVVPPTAAPTGRSVVAVYSVGTNGGTTNRPGLVREFTRVPVPSGAAAGDRVVAGAAVAIDRSELWGDTRVTDADVTGSSITLRLSDAGPVAPDADRAQLAVAALVWTAQGVVGRGDLPVRIEVPGGGPLLGHVGSGATFTRASAPANALCDIWVDDPAPGATVAASRSVVVRGQAVAWEATVEWELLRAGESLRGSFVTASVGAAERGTFTVDLGRLDAGSYTFRAYTTSAEDGSVVAERMVTFTVR